MLVTDDNPVQNVTFPSGSTEAHGYLATPTDGSGPGVVVIQEWWGLTTHIRDVADRLAAEGFVVLAPDLYGGSTTHDADEAASLAQSLPVERAARDLAGAVDYLLGRPSVTGATVGTVGFCMGGGFVLTLAAQQGDRVAVAVPYYPVVQDERPDYSGLTAQVLLQAGDQDDFVPPERVTALAAEIERASGRTAEVLHYPAGHAFSNDENLLGTYDADSAARAWQRTVDTLRGALV